MKRYIERVLLLGVPVVVMLGLAKLAHCQNKPLIFDSNVKLLWQRTEEDGTLRLLMENSSGKGLYFLSCKTDSPVCNIPKMEELYYIQYVKREVKTTSCPYGYRADLLDRGKRFVGRFCIAANIK